MFQMCHSWLPYAGGTTEGCRGKAGRDGNSKGNGSYSEGNGKWTETGRRRKAEVVKASWTVYL